MSDKEQAQLLLEAWKKTVEVQQHFNDIEMRVRNLALTILGAVAAFVKINGVGADKSLDPSVQGLIFVVLTVLVAAFWFMDRHWYHRLLYGSVFEGTKLEEQLRDHGLQISLGSKISEQSPVILIKRLWRGGEFKLQLRSGDKIDIFYLVLGTMALLAAAGSRDNGWLSSAVAFAVVVWSVRCLWWLLAARNAWLENVRQAVRGRAHAIWEQEGRPDGRDAAHWLRAEAENNLQTDNWLRLLGSRSLSPTRMKVFKIK